MELLIAIAVLFIAALPFWLLTQRKCPACRSLIPRGAHLCRHCHVEVRSAADYASSSRGLSPFGILIILVIAGGGFLYFRSQPALAPEPSPSVAEQPAPATAPHFATAAEAQREAIRLYPALSVEGSPLNRAFVARHQQYQRQRPDYFTDSSWPVTLAREVAATTNSK